MNNDVKGRRESWMPGFWTYYLLSMVLLLALAVYGIKRGNVAVAEYNVKAHAAWVKLTGRSDITLEEWKTLRDSKVLNNK